MSKYTHRLGAPVFVVVVSLLAACSGDAKKGPDSTALGADSALNRDLALANRDTAAKPQLNDVPANTPAKTPTPVATRPVTRTPARPPRSNPPRATPAPTPAPTPPAPEPATRVTPSGNTVTTNPGGASNPRGSGGGAVGTIAAGTSISTTAASQICTNTNAVGDHVTATVANGVTGTNGATIPAGATVNMTVTQLKRSENSNDKIVMEFAVNSVSFGGHTYPIEASVASSDVTRVRDESKGKDVQKVATGAVIGAIAGRILGRSTKGTVIGGAAGAAAGAAAASATANYQGCINSGSSIVITLSSAATVRA
jgi:hypothetical protein